MTNADHRVHRAGSVALPRRRLAVYLPQSDCHQSARGPRPQQRRRAAFWYVRAFRPWLRGSVRAGIAINLGFGQSADSTDEGTSEDGCLDGRGREAASPKVRSQRTRIHARVRLVDTPPAPPARGLCRHESQTIIGENAS